MYQLKHFRKSTASQNRQLTVHYYLLQYGVEPAGFDARGAGNGRDVVALHRGEVREAHREGDLRAQRKWRDSLEVEGIGEIYQMKLYHL